MSLLSRSNLFGPVLGNFMFSLDQNDYMVLVLKKRCPNTGLVKLPLNSTEYISKLMSQAKIKPVF